MGILFTVRTPQSIKGVRWIEVAKSEIGGRGRVGNRKAGKRQGGGDGAGRMTKKGDGKEGKGGREEEEEEIQNG